MPLDWVMTQNNLGNALGTPGARESGTARLEEAVAAYRDALKERTRERVPLDWAISLSGPVVGHNHDGYGRRLGPGEACGFAVDKSENPRNAER